MKGFISIKCLPPMPKMGTRMGVQFGPNLVFGIVVMVSEMAEEIWLEVDSHE